MSWNGQQPAELHWSIERLISGEIILMRVSKLKSNILNICYDVFLRNFMTYKAYVTAFMSKSTYVSFRKVAWEQPSGEVGNSVAFLLQISFSICVPKVIKIQYSLTKLLQK